MTLPRALDPVMWGGPATTLCGIALGAPFAELALPDWWSDEHSNGDMRFGWLEVEDGGITNICCSASRTLGRVARVEVSLEIENETAEKAMFGALTAVVTERLGAGRKVKKSVEWDVAGSLAGALEVRIASFNMDGERIHRVEVVLRLADGVEIEADERSLFVDVDALAELLATVAYPRERCREVFARYFARATMWETDEADKTAFHAILAAVQASRAGELRTIIEGVCQLADLSDLRSGESVRGTYLLTGLLHHSPNLATSRSRPTGLLATNVLDVLRFLEILEVPAGERSATAFTVIAALEWDDAAAARAIRDRLAQTAFATAQRSELLVWDSTDEIEARGFALVTSALPTDEARLLAAARTRSFAVSASRACVSYFVQRGLPRPVVRVADEQARASAELLALARAAFANVYDDAVAAFLDIHQHSAARLRAVCDAIAEDKAAGPRTTWRIGAHTVTHSGKPTAGRWTFKRVASSAAKPTPKRRGSAKPARASRVSPR